MKKHFNSKNVYEALLVIGALAFGSFYTFYKDTKLGLDLKGGASILLEAFDTSGAKISSSGMEKLAEVVDRRINSLGVSEPIIQVVGSNKVLVEIPGVNNTEEAVAMIGKTALLEFRLKENDGSLGPAILSGKDLVKAEVSYDGEGMPSVGIQFTNESAKTFYYITKNNIGRQLAITLDGEVQSAPNINSGINSGKAVISGNFSFDEAKKLALLLSAGSLPFKVNIAEVRSISATLGEFAFDRGMKAGMLAISLVMSFMILWYFLPGLIASIALAIFGLITLGSMNFLGATLTLPGIAGLVLSLGMAVDANIIIFEMIKEELKRGNGISASVKQGFNKAFSSILDSNITTLIITTILFMLGTGSVKGYAVTLTLGVLASMFSAIFVTKFLLTLTVDQFGITNPKAFGIFDFTLSFSTIKRIVPIFAISASAITFSSYSLLTKGLNYGVDFTGGNLFSISFNKEVDNSELSVAVNSYKDKDLKAQIQFSKDKDSQIVIKTIELSNDEKEDFYSYLRRKFGRFSIDKEELIGSSVGNSLKRGALLALAIGALLIAIYISLRFEWKFALGAIAALLHDIIISIGAISYLGYEVNSTFIVAILTILGYSINDTVVVFDRIRDNLKKDKNYGKVIDQSINQVFIRSFNTSLTTFLSLMALILFSVSSLKTFLITFLFGIIAGTYSSIFVASPIVYLFDKANKK